MCSNKPSKNQHFIHLIQLLIAKPIHRGEQRFCETLVELSIETNSFNPTFDSQTKLQRRGEERFRETLIELLIETNSNSSEMRHK